MADDTPNRNIALLIDADNASAATLDPVPDLTRIDAVWMQTFLHRHAKAINERGVYPLLQEALRTLSRTGNLRMADIDPKFRLWLVRAEPRHPDQWLTNRLIAHLTPEDFVSRFGRNFKAHLKRRPNGRHEFEFPPREGGGKGRWGNRKKAAEKEPVNGTGEAAPKKALKKAAKTTKKAAKKTTKAPKRAAKKTAPAEASNE